MILLGLMFLIRKLESLNLLHFQKLYNGVEQRFLGNMGMYVSVSNYVYSVSTWVRLRSSLSDFNEL